MQSIVAKWGDQIEKLAAKGSFFIYDLDGLKKHAFMLKQSGLTLWYACKANPLSAILSVLREANFYFDVASTGELQQVLANGISGKYILITGPAKDDAFLRMALSHQVDTFVIESPNQLERLQSLVKEFAYQPSILFRLQLDWSASKEESVLGGSEITPFGMDIDTAKSLIKQTTLPLLGFHVFQWGNILCPNRLLDIWQHTVQVCKGLIANVAVIDVGGGLGIPYDDESPLVWSEVLAKIDQIKERNNIQHIWLELGRYVTGPYGCYITKVVDRKKTYGKEMLVLEGGINHLARPALVHKSFPAQLLRSSNCAITPFSLHGPLCTSLDFLGEAMLPCDVKKNDIIVLYQTGAYGFTESMPFFLAHQLPGEAVIQNEKMEVLREPEQANQWLR